MRRQKTGSWGDIPGDEESASAAWDATGDGDGWGSRETSPTATALIGRRKSHNLGVRGSPPEGVSTPGSSKISGVASGDDEKSSTVNEAALNLANCIMGAGALALPSFFKSCGVILGVLVLLTSGAWTWVSCEMMLRTADAVSHRFLRGKPVGSYEDLVALTLGWRGRVVTTAGIVLLQIGCLVGFANILTDVVSPFAIDILPPGLEPNRGAILAAVTLGGMLPMGIVVGGDAGGVLALVSKLSMCIVAVFAVVLTLHAFVPESGPSPGTGQGADSVELQGADVSNNPGYTPSPIVWFKIEGLMSALPLALFAFGAHPAVLPVVKTMRPHTLQSNTRLVTNVLGGCAVGYLMIGLGGYLSFRKSTAGNVLRNVDGFFLGQTGAKAIKFGYGLVILASVPTILLPLQKSAKDLYVTLVPSAAIQVGGPTPGKPPRSSSKPSRSSSLDEDGVSIDATLERGVVTDVAPEVAARLAQGVALCAMLVALTLSLYVPNVAFAFGLTGSTCSFLVAFILPGLAYLSVTGSGPRGGVKRGLHKRGTNTKADIDVELVPIDEPEVKEGGRSFVSAGGLSKASKSGSSLGNGWEWLQESEDDELSDDPTVSLTGTHPDSTKEKHNGHHASKETADPVKTYFSGTRSERLATKRRRAFAKAQIVVALILMYFCTREVVRELWHERKIVEVVSKITDAKLEAAKLEKDVETIESAKEEYASAQMQFRGALTNATAALSDAERSTAGKSVDHDELEKMNQTIAEKAKQLDNTKAPPIDSNAPPAPPEPTKRKAPAPKQKPTPTPKPLPATPSTEPSSDDSIDATHKAEESLKKVEEVELKSEEAKGKLEDALGMVDEKRKRKEERERSEENDWLEGWVHEHEGEDAGILANVDKVDGKDGKDDKDDNDDKDDKDDKDDNKKKNEKNGANVVKKGDEAKVSTEDFVHGDDVANDYDDKDKGSQGKNDTYIPDPSDVVARAEEKVKELSEQREEVEKKTDEVLKEAAVNEGIDEDEANALAEALAATKLVHSSGAVTEKPKEPSAAVKQEEAKEEEAKEEASEDLFTGR